jgi:hypothetical protein
MSDATEDRLPCPNCGDPTHSHSLTTWCVNCGWAKNHQQETPSPLQQVVAGVMAGYLREVQKLLRSTDA